MRRKKIIFITSTSWLDLKRTQVKKLLLSVESLNSNYSVATYFLICFMCTNSCTYCFSFGIYCLHFTHYTPSSCSHSQREINMLPYPFFNSRQLLNFLLLQWQYFSLLSRVLLILFLLRLYCRHYLSCTNWLVYLIMFYVVSYQCTKDHNIVKVPV